MPRHPLASPDCWVELKDPTELRYGDKLDVMERMKGGGDGEGAAAVGLMIALYCQLVVSWQLPQQLPLPSQDPKVIQMLSLGDGNALEQLVEPARELLFPGASEPAKDTPAEEVEAALKDATHPSAPSVDS